MQLVITIDDKLYEIIKKPKKLEMMYFHAGRLCEVLRKGKPLPKTGRLIDADALIKHIKNLPKCPNGHSQVYDEAMIIDMIEDEPIIINTKIVAKFTV